MERIAGLVKGPSPSLLRGFAAGIFLAQLAKLRKIPIMHTMMSRERKTYGGVAAYWQVRVLLLLVVFWTLR